MKTSTTIQADLFSQSTGESLAVAGMTLAKESADKKVKDWSKRCWQLFLWWLRHKPRYHEFTMYDFRIYLRDMDLIEPAAGQAYGFIGRRAIREGWVGFAGTAPNKEKKAHNRPTNVWFKK